MWTIGHGWVGRGVWGGINLYHLLDFRGYSTSLIILVLSFGAIIIVIVTVVDDITTVADDIITTIIVVCIIIFVFSILSFGALLPQRGSW